MQYVGAAVSVFKREFAGVHIAWQGVGGMGGWRHMGELSNNCKAQHSNALIWPDSV